MKLLATTLNSLDVDTVKPTRTQSRSHTKACRLHSSVRNHAAYSHYHKGVAPFPANKIPPYAILSHTWDNIKPSFQDVSRSGIAGGSKIDKCCVQAKLDGWEYVWIDTCCINKESNAELSEAINSMFNWYKQSGVCYVYLNDVCLQNKSGMSQARWSERGWTLQELLAPSAIIFFDKNWLELGTKWTLREEITLATRISKEYLWDQRFASVAAKKSWASRRTTSLLED